MHRPRRSCAAQRMRFHQAAGWSGDESRLEGMAGCAGMAGAWAAAAQTLPGWEIGPEAYYYAYREPNLMHQIGPAVGVNASYTYKVGTAFLTANGIADVGYVNYKSDGTGNLNGKWDFTGDFRLLAGADVMRNDWFGVSPFTGQI